jgi:hypothetical protein
LTELIAVADITVEVVHKDIKNVHLAVHPPQGRVRITAPKRVQMDVIRLFAISKLPWIRRRQQAMRAQERETVRECIDRESHYVWGQRYLLRVEERDAPPAIELGPRELVLCLRPGTGAARRRDILARWYRDQVRARVAPLVAQWTDTLAVRVERVFVQRMKTKWGSCNPKAATIRLNTELAKKPVDCLEYVTVHEMVHLLEPTHNDRFVALMDRSLPDWVHRRELLKRLPVPHEEWPSPG